MNRIAILGAVAALVAVPLISQLAGTDLRASSVAFAQEAGDPGPGLPPGPAVEPDDALMQAQLRLQQLEAELRGIQDEVLEENEQFRERAEEIDERLFERMEAAGYDDLRGDVRQLEEIIERMEAGEISEQEAQVQLQAQTEIHERLQQAHQEALQDEEFAESLARDQQELSEDVFAAMQEKDSRTDEILQEMEAIERELMRELMERGGQQAPPPGLPEPDAPPPAPTPPQGQ